jgi:hypothetical protein
VKTKRHFIEVAEAAYHAALNRWPSSRVILPEYTSLLG